jgi:hypothetical protein
LRLCVKVCGTFQLVTVLWTVVLSHINTNISNVKIKYKAPGILHNLKYFKLTIHIINSSWSESFRILPIATSGMWSVSFLHTTQLSYFLSDISHNFETHKKRKLITAILYKSYNLEILTVFQALHTFLWIKLSFLWSLQDSKATYYHNSVQWHFPHVKNFLIKPILTLNISHKNKKLLSTWLAYSIFITLAHTLMTLKGTNLKITNKNVVLEMTE